MVYGCVSGVVSTTDYYQSIGYYVQNVLTYRRTAYNYYNTDTNVQYECIGLAYRTSTQEVHAYYNKIESGTHYLFLLTIGTSDDLWDDLNQDTKNLNHYSQVILTSNALFRMFDFNPKTQCFSIIGGHSGT